MLYFFDRNFFLKYGKYWDWNNVNYIKFNQNIESIDIDTEEDFFKASAIWARIKK